MPKGEYLQFGGQAIIEGVMMRSPKYFSVAVRAPNGKIVVNTEAVEKSWIGRQKWLKWPFLRGSLALLDSLALGIKALRFSANIQLDERYQPPKDGEAEPKNETSTEEVAPISEKLAASENKTEVVKGSDSVNSVLIGSSMVVGILMGLFIFVFLPNLAAEQTKRVGVTESSMINLITGGLKIIFFVVYIWLIGFMKDIRVLFQYHGAEHKAINTLELDRDLTMDNCKLNTRLHPRCGTSFAMIVLLISILVFTYIPRYPLGEHHVMILNVLIRFALEIVVLPIIAGISYEFIRLAGKLRASAIMSALVYPGLMTQYLTTREPNEDQIEVALVALQTCMDAEQNGLKEPEPDDSHRTEEPDGPDEHVAEGAN